MKEHPIIFSDEMVNSILGVRKTQTRRVIKPQPSGGEQFHLMGWDWSQGHCQFGDEKGPIYPEIHCKYGKPGDRLWVKENWAIAEHVSLGVGISYPKDPETGNAVMFKATYKNESFPEFIPKWISSRFMPRWARRITLEIVNIRVERVQEISEKDAKVEGAPLGRVLGWGRLGMQSHREGFIELWDSINAKRGYGWDVSPWVWVIEFKRIT